MFLHLKHRQAEELVRIYSKNEKEPIREEFNKSMSNNHIKGKKTVFNMLLTAFNELKGQVSLENISEGFKYTKDCMPIFRQGHTSASVKWEEMNNGKAEQEENISEVLTNLEGESIVAFTDGSALGNPGPTGAEAAIYMNGLNSHAERLKREICKNGNNYLGEIIGLESP